MLPIPSPSGVPSRLLPDDARLLDLWLHGRPPHTQRAYRYAAGRLLSFHGESLQSLTLSDLQAYADTLGKLSAASRARLLSAAKSLLAFGHRTGYLAFDVGRALRLPQLRNRLAERILDETAVQRLIEAEPDPRNHLLLCLLYVGGVRVSELCSLEWRDLQPTGDCAGQVTVFGKGGKTRAIRLPEALWQQLLGLRGTRCASDAVFASRKGGGKLDGSQVCRIVAAAARRVDVASKVSPHWLRHAHASHALDRGAPIHLVQATLGHASIATTGRYLHAKPTDSSARWLAAVSR